MEFLSGSRSVQFVFEHLFKLHCATCQVDSNSNVPFKIDTPDKRRLSSILDSLEIVICSTEKKHSELAKKFRVLRQKSRTTEQVEIFDVSDFLVQSVKWTQLVLNTHPFAEWLSSAACDKLSTAFSTGARQLETYRMLENASSFDVLRLVGEEQPEQWAKRGLDAFEDVDTVWKKFVKSIFNEFKVLNRLIQGETVPLILFQDEHCVRLNGKFAPAIIRTLYYLNITKCIYNTALY